MLGSQAYSHVYLTTGVLRSLKMKTGFNSAEIFRKYLWYLLRERKFDTEAVNDVVQLKSSLQLSDEEVSQSTLRQMLSGLSTRLN